LKRKTSSSFLKKRTKKLLSVSGSTESADLDWLADATDKSLLLLFFRKEVLSCLFSFSPYLGSYLF